MVLFVYQPLTITFDCIFVTESILSATHRLQYIFFSNFQLLLVPTSITAGIVSSTPAGSKQSKTKQCNCKNTRPTTTQSAIRNMEVLAKT